MRKQLFVTGYGGFVAGSVVWQAGREWDVHVVSRRHAPEQRAGFRCWQFDLCDTERLHQTFAQVQPDAVVHTAAMANIDDCQAQQGRAERVNVGITRQLAQLCGDHGSKLVFCSTDAVFDGAATLYTEEDRPRAVNFYAETKLRAEQTVRECAAEAVVARLSLVMGLPVLGAGNSFLAKMITTLRAGGQVHFPENEIRTPIDVITLGQALLELAASDFSGTLHLAGNSRLNRYDMACQIATRLDYSTELIVATNSNAIAGRAPRPNDASLDNAKVRRVLNTPMRTLSDGLDLIIASKERQNDE